MVALVALTLLAVIAGLAGTLIQARTVRQQRDVAFRQLARAEQINNLNRFLLSDANASRKPLMANDLLDRAERIIEREDYTSDPANHVEMLISIGTQYNDEDEIGKALPVLQKAYKLSHGLGDSSVRAKAACALAAPLSRQEPARAESLIREALHELPEEPQFALTRVFCFMQAQDAFGGANVNAQESLAMAQAAARILDASPFGSNYLRLTATLQLAGDYMIVGQVPQSLAAYEHASALITRLGYDDTRMAADLFLDRAQTLMFAGHPLEAEELYRKSLAMSQEEQTGGITSALLMLYSDSLRELGRLDEAAQYAKRALAIAQKAQDNFMVDNCLVRIQRIYRDHHDYKRTASALDELEQRFHRDLAPGHYGFATLASERSLLARATGNLASAMMLADQAVAIDEAAIKAGKQGAFSLPLMLDRRAALEVESQQPDKAIADARRARSLVQTAVGTDAFSMEIGRSYLAQGRALQAQGRSDEARAAFRCAAEHLEKTVGPDHPDARAARQLAEK
jgi:tetratricopeptide (TPR) repeat protein